VARLASAPESRFPRAGLPGHLGGFLGQPQRFQGMAETALRNRETAEGVGHRLLVAQLAVDRQRLLKESEGGFQALVCGVQPSQADQGPGPVSAVGRCGQPCQRPVELVHGAAQIAEKVERISPQVVALAGKMGILEFLGGLDGRGDPGLAPSVGG